MKMGVGTRIIFSILILIIIAVCVGIICAAFGAFDIAQLEGVFRGFTHTGYKYIWASAAALLLIVSVCLLFFGVKKPEETAVLLMNTADGSVSVTLAAIEELAQRYLNEIYGIYTQKIMLHTVCDRQIRMRLYISVKPEVEMPQITSNITEGIKTYIEKYSGISANTVDIRILPIRQPMQAVR